ncbi:MAG: methyltransferase domain-containing protein, partial [Helicobacter sp.]|nr:methyltransferase domain-containing protein [Helicobacter sp.]
MSNPIDLSQSCSICNSHRLKAVLTLENIAASANAVYHDRDEAKRAPKGHLKLVQCQECGFMENIAFDFHLVAYQDYAFSLNHSPLFQKHLDFLVSHLQNNYQIRNAKILEIGCGDAHVLYTIVKATDSKGIGYEPSFAKRNLSLPDDFSDYVAIFSEYYSEFALHKDVDLVLCRFVLEHIPNPLSFLQSINRTLRKGEKNPLVVFEVPYIENSLSRERFYQFIYEHCNYFSPKSLVKLFERSGFEVLETLRCFEKGAFQLICARLKSVDSKPYPCTEVSLFGENSSNSQQWKEWQQKIAALNAVGIWTAGNPAVVFYHLLEQPKQIRCFIDMNPEKQGNFMAVSGLPILSPEQAIEQGITAVIVGNATYDLEVLKMIKEYG